MDGWMELLIITTSVAQLESEVELLLNMTLKYKMNKTQRNAIWRSSLTQWESGCTLMWTCVNGPAGKIKTSPVLLCLPFICSGREGFTNKRWAQKMTSKTKRTSGKKTKQSKKTVFWMFSGSCIFSVLTICMCMKGQTAKKKSCISEKQMSVYVWTRFSSTRLAG